MIARIYQATPLEIANTVELDRKNSHYLAHVLRAQVGDTVIIFNGEGGEYQAIIQSIHKKKTMIKILSFSSREAESSLQLHLAQGIAKGEKMDFIIQKSVELGVNSIIPLITDRSNVRLDAERKSKRRAHWQDVIISACAQSGRNHLPSILPVSLLTTWLPRVQTDYRFVLSPHASNKLHEINIPKPTSMTVLIGPEGGLSEQEIQLAAQYKFIPLQLGPRILRTETASLVAISILQSRFGDLS